MRASGSWRFGPLVLVACSAKALPPPPITPPPPPPSKPVATAPDPFAPLNLGFEEVDGALPKGWSKPVAAGYELTAVGDAHAGAHALQLRATGGGGQFAASSTVPPLALVKGKRLRLHAWVKTEGVAHGYAGLWVRADGDDRVLDNMGGRGVVGTTPWREIVAEIVVPETATGVVMGPLLVGEGTAVWDDLRVELVDVPKPHVVRIAGTVVDAENRPVDSAEVALIAGARIAEHVQSDATGKFQFAPMSGRWGVSAQRAGTVATFRDQDDYQADAQLTLTLGRSGSGTVVAGKVTGAKARSVQISPLSSHDADLFVVPVGPDGAFAAELPSGDDYRVEVLEGGFGSTHVKRTGGRVEVTLAAVSDGPPPQPVVDWIAAHAVPLATADPAHDVSDMAPLGKLVAKARIVALGEATHGTREFFQLKHRFLAYLVEKLGFSVFAIEANQPECRAINDYVLRGTGDAKTALAGIYFWTWNTEEVLAMIEWMRAWNADPTHKTKVQFTGFDMQTATVAYKNVAAYLARVGGDASLVAAIEPLAHASALEDLKAAPPDARSKLTVGLAALGKAFDTNKKAWVAKSSAGEFDDLRHDVTVLEQATAMYLAPGPFDIRDRSMAENIGWLLDHQPKGTRMMVWAHNGHIANTLQTFANMGSHLRKKYKGDYLNLGFVFSQGGFQAMAGNPPNLKLKEITVGPPVAGDTSVAFARTGVPLLVLDLRALPKTGDVHDWFAVQHPTRDIGALFVDERSMAVPESLPALYDAVIFVDKTTRARPLKAP